MRVAAIILAAGTGRRFAKTTGLKQAKQFVDIAGIPVIRHTLNAFLGCVDLIQTVGDVETLKEICKDLPILPPVYGGALRQDSVRCGLEALDKLPDHKKPDIVLIHDGARPYVSKNLLHRVIDGAKKYPAAIPALPVVDTLKWAPRCMIKETVSRQDMYRAQTPQAFRFDMILALHRKVKKEVTDDASLMEKAGFDVVVVKGDDDNIKLTYATDLKWLEKKMSPDLLPHIGLGYDVHAFAPEKEKRSLVICGIEIPHIMGLAGHSDADVGIHALCDALYGAVGEGDIGGHFPPSNKDFKNMDSAHFLKHAANLVAKKGGRFVNADLTLICEKPKMGPHILKMRQRLAQLMNCSQDVISVKATTTERLGFTGRQEGIACLANVCVLMASQ